jgi:hypothetical protein
MSAFQELSDYYREWRRLSELEGAAIRDGKWPEVQSCQDAKFTLQSNIMLATEMFQSELVKSGNDPQEYDRQFRGIVAELIQLEERNGKWLSEQKKKATEESERLARTSSNLRQVRGAYVHGARTHWNSYS